MTARLRQQGWRSARATASAIEPTPIMPGAPVGSMDLEAAQPLRGARARALDPSERIQWTLPYVGLLAYLFAITTFRLPIATAAMGLACAGLLLQRERWRLPPFLLWFAAYVVWSAIGAANSPVPELSRARLEDLAKVWLVTLVAVNAVRSWAQLRFLMITYLAWFAIYPVRGTLINYALDITTYGRTAWNFTFSNANDLAAICLLQLSMAVCLVRDERSRLLRVAAACGIAVLPFVILVTQSRGAFIAACVFGIVVMLGHQRRLRALATGAVLLGGLLMVAPDAALERVGGLRHLVGDGGLGTVDREQSARQRWEIWQVAASVVSDHPLFGVGVGAYPIVHAQYALNDRFDVIARGRRDTHSTYMNVLAESGWPGLVLFASLVLTGGIGIERVRRSHRAEHPREARRLLCLEAGLAAFFVAGIWGSFGHLTYTYVHLALTWTAAQLLAASARQSGALEGLAFFTVHRRGTR